MHSDHILCVVVIAAASVPCAGVSLVSGGPCPGEGDCCAPNGSPGCDDRACCILVCSLDAFCCDSEWDQICANLAGSNCEACIPTLACCIPLQEGCFDLEERLCIAQGGVPQGFGTDCSGVQCPPTCCCVFADHIEGDVSGWIVIDGGAPGDVGLWEPAVPNPTVFLGGFAAPPDDATPGPRNTIAFVTKNGPAGDDNPTINDVDGGPFHLITPIIDLASPDATIFYTRWVFSEGSSPAHIPDFLTVGVSNDGGTTWTSVPEHTTANTDGWETVSFLVADYVVPTTQVRVRFTISDSPNNSVTEAGIDDLIAVATTCAPCPGAGNCCIANGSPGCEDDTCCNQVCDLDPSCCDQDWDEACAKAAMGICSLCPDCPGGGSCCVANGSPGCDDQTCCTLVCLRTPACCDLMWDETCALDAVLMCEACAETACPGTGTCCAANGSPGCEEEACCNQVCILIPHCCDTSWDHACAQGAFLICETCMDAACPGVGRCCIGNGTPGCEDETCCNQVCALDAMCCDTAWDSSCAQSAILVCGICQDPRNGCPTDVDGNGSTDVTDLVAVILAWGTDDPQADIDDSGNVDVSDLVAIILAWGPCDPTCCQGTEMPEGEPCGDDTNGGANSTPQAFTLAECGGTYCGTAWAEGGTRDTDWYFLTVSAETEWIAATLNSEFDGVCFIVADVDGNSPVVLGVGASVICDTVAYPAEACLESRNVVVFVATSSFDGVPCGSEANDYSLLIECASVCTPQEACCFFNQFFCTMMLPNQCIHANGVPQGPGSTCAPSPCPPLCGFGLAGDCCEPNGTPNCDQLACCDAICVADPSCCETEWDGNCADAATASPECDCP